MRFYVKTGRLYRGKPTTTRLEIYFDHIRRYSAGDGWRYRWHRWQWQSLILNRQHSVNKDSHILSGEKHGRVLFARVERSKILSERCSSPFAFSTSSSRVRFVSPMALSTFLLTILDHPPPCSSCSENAAMKARDILSAVLPKMQPGCSFIDTLKLDGVLPSLEDAA